MTLNPRLAFYLLGAAAFGGALLAVLARIPPPAAPQQAQIVPSDPTPSPTSEPLVTVGPSPTVSAFREAVREATRNDQAKPRFRGQLGPFTIPEGAQEPQLPCAEGSRAGPGDPHNTTDSVERLYESELYFSPSWRRNRRRGSMR